MKKWIALIMTGALLLLTACGGPSGAADVEIDLDLLAEQLLDSGIFEEPLNRTDPGIAEKIYGIAGAAEAQLYVGSGATADELALFAFADAESAQAAVQLAELRVADQRESFADYLPQEVPKLDRAVIQTRGPYLVVCISGSDDAGQIISPFLAQEG